MNTSAKIAQIHYRYQQGENKEKQDAYATRKLGRLGYTLDSARTTKDSLDGNQRQ